MSLRVVALSLALCVLLVSHQGEAWKSASECESLGFEKNVVRCEDCEALNFYTREAALVSECVECCFMDEKQKNENFVEQFDEAVIQSANIEWALRHPESSQMGRFREQYYYEAYFPLIRFETAENSKGLRLTLSDFSMDNDLTLDISFWKAEELHELLVKKLRVDLE